MTKKTIFYKKEGRKYIPVHEYDQELMDALPKGAHMILVYPGGKSTRYNIEPATAPMLAAGRVAEDELAKALVKAGEIRMQRGAIPLTPGQKAAWENLVKEFGDNAKQLEWPSAREVAEAGVKALQQEAEMLLSNEAVRKSYDHFILMCKLTKEAKNVDA